MCDELAASRSWSLHLLVEFYLKTTIPHYQVSQLKLVRDLLLNAHDAMPRSTPDKLRLHQQCDASSQHHGVSKTCDFTNAGNYVDGEIDLAARADFIEKVRQNLLPPNGEPTNRILLGQVLKSEPLVGEALLYKAPNSKSADLTGNPETSACT